MASHQRSRRVPLLLATAAAFTLQTHLAGQMSATFGSGANQFTMDFVAIGNAGNTADDTGHGAVPYGYWMGQHEVSRDMIAKANSAGGLGITMFDMTPYGGNGVNRPVTGVTWYEAAAFVNWLNTSQGGTVAYKFSGGSFALWKVGDAGYNAANPYRNSLATYFLPSENEWYKAAYYDGTSGLYYNYPTGSDSAPTPVGGGTTAGTAVYGQLLSHGPADVANAGGLSPYGTMGQGGNVFEWVESASDGVNDSGSEDRVFRGGSWSASFLQSSVWGYDGPASGNNVLGFRVAAVPEPLESAGLTGVAALGFALWRRRGSL